MSGKSWLDDDPEWRELRDRIEGRKQLPDSEAHSLQGEVEEKAGLSNATHGIKKLSHTGATFIRSKANSALRWPGFSSLRLSNKSLKSKKTASMALVVIIAVAVFQIQAINSPATDDVAQSEGQGSDVLSQQSSEPEYDTLIPAEEKEKIEDKVLYDPNRKVASFTDDIGGIPIIVSMQPLPGAFSSDPVGYVEKLAADMYADQKISESNPVAFTGKNVNGVQTTIFSKKGLLVFLQATQEVDKKDLAAYITSLD